MNKHLTTAAIAMALVMTAGCKPRTPEELPPVPEGSSDAGTDTGTGLNDGGVGNTAVEGSRAHFLQSVPSDRVFFDTDDYSVDAEDRATLDAQADWLLRYTNVTVTIEGHADERGTREYNLALGDRRANAAKNYLQSRGVPANRMTVVSWGKERPVALGSDESAWAQNRRAVTVIPQ